MSKVIAILGGSGYIGKHCTFRLLKNDLNCLVKVVSRSGKADFSQYNLTEEEKKRIEIVKGDALNPNDLSNVLGECTGVIHSIGALLTTSADDSPYSYEMKNHQSAIRPAALINSFPTKIKKVNFVYVSAERGLPFPLSLRFSGYINTKKQTERELIELENLNSIILRPGMVKDNKLRSWSIPIFYAVGAVNMIEKCFLSKINSNLGETLQLPSRGTELDILADTASKAALGLTQKNIFNSEDLIKYL